MKSPRAGIAEMKERIGSVDKDTAISILVQRGDIDQAEAEQIVDNIMTVLDEIKSTIHAGEAAVSAKAHEIKSSLENKMKNYLDSLDQKELNYEEIKDDIQIIFHDYSENRPGCWSEGGFGTRPYQVFGMQTTFELTPS